MRIEETDDGFIQYGDKIPFPGVVTNVKPTAEDMRQAFIWGYSLREMTPEEIQRHRRRFWFFWLYVAINILSLIILFTCV